MSYPEGAKSHGVCGKSIDAVRGSIQNATAVSNILSEMSVRNTAEVAKPIQDRTYAALEEIETFALTAIKSPHPSVVD